MLEKLLLPKNHAIAILIHDHDTVKDLFDRFEKTESSSEKEKMIAEAVTELKIHALIEEEIFYPAVRKELEKDMMNEADEEHHVAKVLIAELDLNDRNDDHRHAKFTVLSESVRHHIKEEEGEMLPKAKGLDLDFEALGEQMLARKNALKKGGIPDDAEHDMVSRTRGQDDSPAKAARRTAPQRHAAKKSPSNRRPVAAKPRAAKKTAAKPKRVVGRKKSAARK